MMFGVPGAGRLMKAAQPDHRIRHHLVTDLEALEIVFLRGDEVFAENAKLLMIQPEDDIGVEPRVIQARMRLTVSREPLRGYENFEFARRLFTCRVVVLRPRGTPCCQGQEREQGDDAPRSPPDR